MPGPTRAASLVGDDNQGITLTADTGPAFATYDDAVIAYDEGWVTYDGGIVATDITASHVTSGDDNDSEELVAGTPRAVLIGAGANSLVEV